MQFSQIKIVQAGWSWQSYHPHVPATSGGGASHQSHYHHHFYYPQHTIFDTRYFSRCHDAPRSGQEQRGDTGFHELGKIGYIIQVDKLIIWNKIVSGPVEEAAREPSIVQRPKQELPHDIEDAFFNRQHVGVVHADKGDLDISSSHRRLGQATPTQPHDAGNDGTKNVCGICGKM